MKNDPLHIWPAQPVKVTLQFTSGISVRRWKIKVKTFRKACERIPKLIQKYGPKLHWLLTEKA